MLNTSHNKNAIFTDSCRDLRRCVDEYSNFMSQAFPRPGGPDPGLYGYELHCKRPGQPISGPNNLEVNLSTGQHFHLTSLNSAYCVGPDFYGTGTGRLNGSAASIWFRFLDNAEPGAGADIAGFSIDTAAGNLLECSNTLEGGNNQAHQATGNK